MSRPNDFRDDKRAHLSGGGSQCRLRYGDNDSEREKKGFVRMRLALRPVISRCIHAINRWRYHKGDPGAHYAASSRNIIGKRRRDPLTTTSVFGVRKPSALPERARETKIALRHLNLAPYGLPTVRRTVRAPSSGRRFKSCTRPQTV